jgi:3-phenylpropionate/cinnamic acid dioxygenase small subunit
MGDGMAEGVIDTAVWLGINELNAAYADCIDEDRLEKWPDFFTGECRYLITDRESHQAGLKHGIIYCASRGMLEDRVTALRRVLMFEAHRYRHIIGAASIERIQGGVAVTRTNFLTVRIMHDGETQMFVTGRYLDRIAVGSRPFRFVERIVVLDSQKIDTLLVIPL